MAGTKKTEDPRAGRLKLALGTVLLGVGVFMAIAPIFDISIFRADYKPDPLVLGTVIGSGLLLLGIETANRLPGITIGKREDKEPEK